ncbi:MAG: PAS domain S-box protein [Bacteroidota bacterium]|jgi:PAS domain S-box-containing protein
MHNFEINDPGERTMSSFIYRISTKIGFLFLLSCILQQPQLCSQTEKFYDSWRWAHFTTASGLPSDRVSDVVETPGGTVWAITQSGMAWFNGYYWIPTDTMNGLTGGNQPGIVAGENDSLLVIIEGDLYYGSKNGFRSIPFVVNGQNKKVASAACLPGGGFLLLSDHNFYTLCNGLIHAADFPPGTLPRRVIRMWSTRGRGIWINTFEGLYRWELNRWSVKIPRYTIPLNISHVAEDTSGNGIACIIGPVEDDGIWEWSANTAPTHNKTEREHFIQSLDVGPENEAIIVQENGAIRIRKGPAWTSLQPQPPQVNNILFVKYRDNGDLWVGTENGLYLQSRSSQRWTIWKSETSESRNFINELLQTRDGSVWMAADGGLEIRRPDGRIEAITRIDGVNLTGITGLGEDIDGNIWISSGSFPIGAYRWNGTAWKHFGASEGLTADNIHKIRKDREGRLWFLGVSKLFFGAEQGMKEPGAFLYSQGKFTHWGTEEDLLGGRVYAFAEGPDSALWFGTNGGLSRWKTGTWTHWTTKQGLKSDRVFALAVDNENKVWFADQSNGLGCLENDQPHYFTTSDGLVSNIIWDIRVDSTGKLWIGTHGGLSSYFKGTWATFDVTVGLINSRIWPVLPVNGRVFVGTTDGVAILNLEASSRFNPQVVLASPVVEKGTVLLRWNAFAHWGELSYQDIETRYQLDDRAWSPWSKEREKTLGKMSSGEHHFHVQAKGLAGNYDEHGQSIDFIVEPPLFLRPAFYLPLGASAFVILVLLGGMFIRKQHSTALLRDSEERYRTLAEAARDMIFILDPDRHIQYVNNVALEQTGLAKEDIIGKKLDEIFPGELGTTEWINFSRVFERGESFYSENELKIAKQKRWMGTQLAPIRNRAGDVSAVLGISRDITNRVRSEEALVRLNKAVEASGEVLFMTDKDGVITFVNPEFTRLYGYQPEEVIGVTTPRKLKSGVLPQETYIGFWQTLMNRQVAKLELVNRTKDGRLINVEGSANPILDAQGNITGFLAVQRDITARVQAERELKLMAQTIASARDCISITDMDDNILYVNAAFLETYGYAEEEVLGEQISRIARPSSGVVTYRGILPATLSGGWHGEILNHRKDGREFPVELWTSLVKDDAGNPVALVGVARDITERKRAEDSLRQSEERFRSLFEESKDCVFVNTVSGKIVDINPAGVELFGYASKDEMLRLDIGLDMYRTPSDRQNFLEVIKRQGYVQDYELPLKRKDGSTITVLETATAVRDEKGNIVAYRGIIRDITERKRAQEEREKLIHDLQEAFARVKQLSGLLPICASCKKIRDDKGYWTQVEKFITSHSEATFSHGVCPDCARKLYPDIYKDAKNDG